MTHNLVETLLTTLDTACQALESAADYADGPASELIQSIADMCREVMAKAKK